MTPLSPLPSDARALLPRAGAVDLLFLLFHGAGAEADQMRPLAQALHGFYPQAAVVMVAAPQRLDSEVLQGFQWFDEDAQGAVAGVAAALPDFIATVRAWQTHFQLAWQRVALAGFSQGGLMALEAVLAEPQLAGRVLSFGAAPLHRPTESPEGVCLHLLHGLLDAEMPYRHVVDAAQTWVDLGADVTADVLPGVGHELDPRLIERALHQLRTFIPAKLWREAVVTAAEMEKADAAALQRGKAH